MTSIEFFVLVIVGSWLGVLTLVAVLLVRQLGLITVRLDGQTFSLFNDGPVIGSEVPPAVLELIPELMIGTTPLLFVSTTCRPCHELIEQIRLLSVPSGAVCVVAGSDELADGVIAELPDGFVTVQGPNASKVAALLHIQSTPFGIRFEDGLVADKSYLRDAHQFLEMAQPLAHLKVELVSNGKR